MRLVIISLLLFLPGCSLFFTKPEVRIRELQFVSLDSSGMAFDLVLGVNNPNPFELGLQGYNYDVMVLDIPFAMGGKREAVSLPAKSGTDFHIPVRFEYGSILRIIKLRLDPKSIPYRLTAALDVTTPLGVQYIPLETAGTFAIPDEYRSLLLIRRLGENLAAP